ncbi:MAG: CBS domain-containing protein [Deltaproteobacteria bacterium]|nr:CBS domain-containing protein [Deltaproteobacteria bacterium]MBW2070500.1 CBS domain-containing protein [Deltaproteobacteria bacterium]
MLVSRRMSRNPVTISPEASIQEAITLMKTHSVRHLPVVNREDTLVGWVTDGDLRGVLIPSMIEELSIGDVMISNPITVSASEVLEKAALLITEHKIGGMPVLEDGKLVGVLTVVDILRAFIDIMGVLRSSSRIDVLVTDCRVEFQEVSRIIREHDGEIISVGILREEPTERIYSFRLQKCDIDRLKEALEAEGHRVVSATP